MGDYADMAMESEWENHYEATHGIGAYDQESDDFCGEEALDAATSPNVVTVKEMSEIEKKVEYAKKLIYESTIEIHGDTYIYQSNAEEILEKVFLNK